MPPSLAAYITAYGYVAIFSLVFLQEIGIPNPVPNELILLFSGYLASIKTLSFLYVVGTTVAADFVGTATLYGIFYFFGHRLLSHPPRWLPITHEKIRPIRERIERRGWWGIYLGRLVPYVRGYTSVAAGLIELRPFTYLTAVLASALTWSGGYVIAGFFLGPYWERALTYVHHAGILIGLVALLISSVLFVRWFKKKKSASR